MQSKCWCLNLSDFSHSWIPFADCQIFYHRDGFPIDLDHRYSSGPWKLPINYCFSSSEDCHPVNILVLYLKHNARPCSLFSSALVSTDLFSFRYYLDELPGVSASLCAPVFSSLYIYTSNRPGFKSCIFAHWSSSGKFWKTVFSLTVKFLIWRNHQDSLCDDQKG